MVWLPPPDTRSGCTCGVNPTRSVKLSRVALPRLLSDAYLCACGASQPLSAFKVIGVATSARAKVVVESVRAFSHPPCGAFKPLSTFKVLVARPPLSPAVRRVEVSGLRPFLLSK